jgi:hypothetical protein
VVGDSRNGGAGGDADRKPFCGSLETQQKCAAVGDSHGGVSFVQQRRRPVFFVRQIFLESVVLDGACAAVL